MFAAFTLGSIISAQSLAAGAANYLEQAIETERTPWDVAPVSQQERNGTIHLDGRGRIARIESRACA
jgi:hypothetical protein